jgi:hypothetical protein
VTRAVHLASGYPGTTPAKWLVFLLVLFWSVHGFAMERPLPTAGKQNATSFVSNLESATTLSQSNPAHPSSREPFALPASSVTTGEVLAKWRLVEEKIDGEAAVLERCRARQECPPGAQDATSRFWSITLASLSRMSLEQGADCWRPNLASHRLGARWVPWNVKLASLFAGVASTLSSG